MWCVTANHLILYITLSCMIYWSYIYIYIYIYLYIYIYIYIYNLALYIHVYNFTYYAGQIRLILLWKLACDNWLERPTTVLEVPFTTINTDINTREL